MTTFHDMEEERIDAWERAVQANRAQVDTRPPITGKILVTYEDGSEGVIMVRGASRIVKADFEPVGDSSPWDYDDPDGDGIYNGRLDGRP